MFQRYKSYSPYDMQESITKEVKGDLQKSFLVIGEHLSAVLIKLFILYHHLWNNLFWKCWSFFQSSVLKTNSCTLPKDWMKQWRYIRCCLFNAVAFKNETLVLTQVWLHRVKEPKRSCWPELLCHAVKWTWRKCVLSTRPTLESLCKRLLW